MFLLLFPCILAPTSPEYEMIQKINVNRSANAKKALTNWFKMNSVLLQGTLATLTYQAVISVTLLITETAAEWVCVVPAQYRLLN